ncbi:MAG TPA: TldD/PmbA family protein [candidate division Zixibacteria bacterium]|nr:TldD/PmbA family protein [candidate division Zixibacteria bacterium]
MSRLGSGADLKDVLAKVVSTAVQGFKAEYVEVRAQKLRKTAITVKEARVEAAKQGIENGTALRVLVKGAWGFASISTLNVEALSAAVSDACRMARAASARRRVPVKLAPARAVEDKVVLKPRKDPGKVPVEDKMNLLLTVNNTVLQNDNRVKSVTTNYLDLTGTGYFINSEGAYIEQGKLYVFLGVSAVARENDVFTYSREAMGSTSGYEVFDVETPVKVAETVARRATAQLKAKPPRGGTFPVVLGPNVVGTFVHEAFGHLAEADITLSGSVLSDKLEKKVASNVVTFYDDGTVNGAFGSFKYDDEGVPAQKTLLVKDGALVGLMHSRETAQQLSARPTGNSRAEDFRVEPIVRMRNTFIEARDYSFEELIEGVKFGYYLKSFRGGEANLDGTFQIGIQEAYEIVKGEIGEPVRNASISGNTLETLFKVDAVGKEFELWPGVCGKGQSAFVSQGGAHTRVKGVMVGGSA